jgi:hypothetical protein
MYQWMVFLHILGALVLFMAHGASAVMAFRLRQERNPERIRTLLDFSAAALPVMYLGLLMLLVGGIAAGVIGRWWAQGWIGTALLLVIVLVVWMGLNAQRQYGRLRKAVGITYRGVPGMSPPASAEEIVKMAQATNPLLLTVGSVGITAVILWLMIFKPF